MGGMDMMILYPVPGKTPERRAAAADEMRDDGKSKSSQMLRRPLFSKTQKTFWNMASRRVAGQEGKHSGISFFWFFRGIESEN